jgi:serum amyloid A protein
MGCKKLSYYESEGLKVNSLFLVKGGLEKEGTEQKKRLNYYPFGSEMPGRSFRSGDNYKHGYQGQFTEKDEEVNWDAFELRNWDGRLARWTSIDPYSQFWSPYLGMGNNPINGVDPDGGLFGKWRAQRFQKKHGGDLVQSPSGKWGVHWNDGSAAWAKDFGFQGLGGGDNFSNSSSNPIAQGVYQAQRDVVNAPSEMAEFYKQYAGGIKDFAVAYDEMIDANWVNSDKYFHSKANFNAARRGPGGDAAAERMSNFREVIDHYVKGDPRSASIADQRANAYGRAQGAKYHGINHVSYRKTILKYRPFNLCKFK